MGIQKKATFPWTKYPAGGSGDAKPPVGTTLLRRAYADDFRGRAIFTKQIADRSTIRFCFDLGAQHDREASRKFFIHPDVTKGSSADDNWCCVRLSCRFPS